MKIRLINSAPRGGQDYNFKVTKNYPPEADFYYKQTNSICSQAGKFSKNLAMMQAKILQRIDLF